VDIEMQKNDTDISTRHANGQFAGVEESGEGDIDDH
jgi:hypothetical protein